MKACKYIYYIIDSNGVEISPLPWWAREAARNYKRYAENDHFGEFEFNPGPYKIVRFAVNPTSEVIR